MPLSKPRAREAKTGATRIPIVAVTASVLQGERARCLAAGMNDYVAKPFRLADIAAVMEKWIKVERV